LIADTPSAVKAQVGRTVLELRLDDHRKGIKMLEGNESLHSLVLSGDKIHALVDDPREAERVIREVLKAGGIEILGLIEIRPSLEDVFVSIIRSKSPHPPFTKGG